METPCKTLAPLLAVITVILFALQPVFGEGPPLPAVVFYVDSELGADGDDVHGENELGSEQQPVRSVTHALDLVAKRNAPEVAVLIKAGRSVRDVSEGGAEKLPLYLFLSPAEGAPTHVSLPTNLKLLSFRGWNGTPTLVGSPEASLYKTPFFDVELGSPALPPESEGVTVEFRRLEFSQGLSGVSFLTVGRTPRLVARFEQCRFSNQAGRGIELFQGEDSNVDLTVRDCVFEGSSGGMLLETGKKARLTFLVEGSLFQWIRGYGPGGILGSGVDLHLDDLGDIHARIQRNVFQGLSTAVQLTSSEGDSSKDPALQGDMKGRLEAHVVSNLIGGRSRSGVLHEPSVKTGLYLSLWPHHQITLRVANNTFAGIEGYVMYSDNTDFLRDSFLHDGGAFVPWVFANNICRRVGAVSEFDSEVAGESFPPAGVTIRSNFLEKSRLASLEEDGNWSGDPGFVNEDGLDFHLRPGSLGIDHGDVEYVEDFTADLDGNCRRARAECSLDGSPYPVDLGAYESPGFCDSEPAVFRRGDCNQSSGNLDIGDAILTFSFLFLGGESPRCMDACDSNDDGKVGISDGIMTLSYLFLGGRAPPPPFETVGYDPTRDCLSACKNR